MTLYLFALLSDKIHYYTKKTKLLSLSRKTLSPHLDSIIFNKIRQEKPQLSMSFCKNFSHSIPEPEFISMQHCMGRTITILKSLQTHLHSLTYVIYFKYNFVNLYVMCFGKVTGDFHGYNTFE